MLKCFQKTPELRPSDYKQMLVVGLDYSGKTTFIKNCKKLPEGGKEFYTTTPYLNLDMINLPSGAPCIVYDLSGQGRYREGWSYWYSDIDGIIFVVDSTDHERFYVVKELLREIAAHPALRLRQIPFVIACNKMEAKGAVRDAELRQFLQIDSLKPFNQMKYMTRSMSGQTGTAVNDCLNFFEENA